MFFSSMETSRIWMRMLRKPDVRRGIKLCCIMISLVGGYDRTTSASRQFTTSFATYYCLKWTLPDIRVVRHTQISCRNRPKFDSLVQQYSGARIFIEICVEAAVLWPQNSSCYAHPGASEERFIQAMFKPC